MYMQSWWLLLFEIEFLIVKPPSVTNPHMLEIAKGNGTKVLPSSRVTTPIISLYAFSSPSSPKPAPPPTDPATQPRLQPIGYILNSDDTDGDATSLYSSPPISPPSYSDSAYREDDAMNLCALAVSSPDHGHLLLAPPDLHQPSIMVTY
ncbi:hypothetical protein L1887_35674 [Cichorium endivia]|nr:hypothetical protein L1887_35674 [Cichorium endivia]